MQAIGEIIANTGYEEISLLSLSSSDYVYVHELTDAVHERYGGSGLSLSLPSLRIESTSADLLDKLGRHAPQRLHLRAGSRHRAHAQRYQQVRAARAGAPGRARCVLAGLADDQVLLHDRPS
jgi:hypothetical protein